MINFTTLLRNGERIMRLVPTVRSLLPDSGNSAEASLLKIIKQRDDALYAKKNEIEILKKNNSELEKQVRDLEENLDNCRYTIDQMQLTLTKEGL
jgi:septal ring factor EnvC (AmiA/AmiB activator)